MVQERSPAAKMSADMPTLPGTTSYSPWDARTERLERRASFWAMRLPMPRPRSGRIGRVEFMVPQGNA